MILIWRGGAGETEDEWGGEDTSAMDERLDEAAEEASMINEDPFGGVACDSVIVCVSPTLLALLAAVVVRITSETALTNFSTIGVGFNGRVTIPDPSLEGAIP